MTQLPSVESLISKISQELSQYIRAHQLENPAMIGIHTGGTWIAQRLHQNLKLADPLGALNISFYRDDYSSKGLHPQVKPSELKFSTENRHIILVDDVLMSGRTIRAALNEIFDYGRPDSVTLVTLIDLNARQLPIQADITGQSLALAPNERIKLLGPEPLSLEIRQTKENPTTN